VEPLLHPAGAARFGRPGPRAQPHPGQPQPVQLLRPHPSSRSTRSRTTSNTATISAMPGGTSSSSTNATTSPPALPKLAFRAAPALARLLAGRSDTMILLSATPHDGSARSFASLMSLLDPTAISDPEDYTPDDFRNKGLVIRRFKKDIKDQVSADFQERDTCLRQNASPQEEAAYRALLAMSLHPGRQAQPRQAQPSCSGWACRKACSPARPLRWNPRKSASRCSVPKPHATADEPTKSKPTGFRCRPAPDRRRQLQQIPASAGASAQRPDSGWQPDRLTTAWSSSPSASKPFTGCASSSAETSAQDAQLEVCTAA
jgi:hypothetical protein